MTYPCPSVVTTVTLDTQQIKLLIDLLWGAPLSVVSESSKRHGVDDVKLEGHLAKCLGSALAELD
jgi:hypothetical protein